MNDNFTLNEIEKDVNKVVKLNKEMLDGAMENFKKLEKIAKLIEIKANEVNLNVQDVNNGTEIIGKVADSVGVAYENYNFHHLPVEY